MGSGTLAAGGARRRAHLFWWTVALVLPFVDPPVLALLSLSEAMALPALLGVVLIALGNWWVLSRVSRGAWSGADRNKRVFLGVVFSLVLAIAFAYAEFIGYLLIACSQHACFD
jgi:hypothetical protein